MTRQKLGPEATRAMRAPIYGRKRRAILVLIAVYIDGGRPNPSISELAARSRLRRLLVVYVVDALERDGLLAVQRTPRQRNTYRLLIGRGTEMRTRSQL